MKVCKNLKAINIKWSENDPELPTEVELQNNITLEDEIPNYLAAAYGVEVTSFDIKQPDVEITQMLTLSTTHILPSTSLALNNELLNMQKQELTNCDLDELCIFAKHDGRDNYGYYIYCDKLNLNNELFEKMPDDLKEIVKLARQLECNVICLDAAGPIVPGLPCYGPEWLVEEKKKERVKPYGNNK
jgi:hypothetical protein